MDKSVDWTKYLSWAKFAHNSSYHEGFKLTPFEIVYGRRPPTIPMYSKGSFKIGVTDQDLKTR